MRSRRLAEPRRGISKILVSDRLRIELDDAASSSWWARILYTLASQQGQSQLRFVGKTDGGRVLYRGDTFPSPPLGAASPRETWAPGMEGSLTRLESEIARDGWVEDGRGPRPWNVTYVRARRPEPFADQGKESRAA
jgi:hypothetical protein